MTKLSLDQIDVTGKRVLIRVDFNVPLDDAGAVTDDRRIRAALPGVQSVTGRGGRAILISHLGRPDGPDPAQSLEPAADRLRELMPDATVRFTGGDCAGAEAARSVDMLGDGEVLVLENLRFNPGEKKGDAAFASRLAAYGDAYCNDAFGSAHRSDASMVAVPRAMQGKPRVAGPLLLRELHFLSDVLAHPARPFVAILGGAKVSDKLGAIRNLAGRVDAVLVGGAMAYTFLKARGTQVGSSRVEPDLVETARSLLETGQIVLPGDHVCGRELSASTPVEVFAGDIPDGWMGLDIGPATADDFAARIDQARTCIWNGPVGVFETPPFDAGTRRVAEALAAATRRGATTVAGGGDTAAALESFGLDSGFSHVSTGGGASLQMLEGRPFESVELLDDA